MPYGVSDCERSRAVFTKDERHRLGGVEVQFHENSGFSEAFKGKLTNLFGGHTRFNLSTLKGRD
jgi:hypothetical protein